MAITSENPGPHTLGKVRPHQTQNEALLFEKSSPGKRAYKLPPLDVPAVDSAKLLGAARRDNPGLLPELSEIEIIRHFTRLSTWNYAIDLGMYPLGSCTMKYNPRVNELVARIEGLAEAHPYRPESLAQGILEIFDLLQRCLLDITGMDAITLQPAAGAHGEFTGILLTRAWHESQGNPRKKIIIPDSAHGTNPATAAIVGYSVENLKSNADGGIDLEALTRQVDGETAALMLTNPSTLGVFESQIHKIADILHAKGALLYMDGANMNALVGKVRPGDFGVDVMHLNLHKTFSTPHGGGGPGSGPVACKAFLEPFLPIPVLVRGDKGREPARTPGIGRTPMPSRRPTAARHCFAHQFSSPMASVLAIQILCRFTHSAGRCAGSMTVRNPSAACAPFTATPGCSFARWPTSSPTAPTACARPPKTPCSTPITSVKNSKTSTSCPTKQLRCTRWSSATSGRRRAASRPVTSPSVLSITAFIPTRSASRSLCTGR